jgi:hypothetical protein
MKRTFLQDQDGTRFQNRTSFGESTAVHMKGYHLLGFQKIPTSLRQRIRRKRTRRQSSADLKGEPASCRSEHLEIYNGIFNVSVLTSQLWPTRPKLGIDSHTQLRIRDAPKRASTSCPRVGSNAILQQPAHPRKAFANEEQSCASTKCSSASHIKLDWSGCI